MEQALQVIQVLLDVLIFLIIPFVIFCVINIVRLNTNMEWVMGGLKILGDKSGVLLHSPHTPEFDDLIEKFWHGTLDRVGAVKLCGMLDKIIHEDSAKPIEPGKPFTPGQKSTATQMLAAVSTICRISRERGGDCQK